MANGCLSSSATRFRVASKRSPRVAARWSKAARGKLHDAQRVLETRMGTAGVNHVCQAKLPDMPQSSKNPVVDDPPFVFGEPNEPVYRATNSVTRLVLLDQVLRVPKGGSSAHAAPAERAPRLTLAEDNIQKYISTSRLSFTFLGRGGRDRRDGGRSGSVRGRMRFGIQITSSTVSTACLPSFRAAKCPVRKPRSRRLSAPPRCNTWRVLPWS